MTDEPSNNETPPKNGLTRRFFLTATTAIAAQAKLGLNTGHFPSASAGEVMPAAIPTTAAESWVASTMQLGVESQNAWVEIANWQNKIKLWEFAREKNLDPFDIPEEEAEAYIRQELRKFFVDLLNPFVGYQKLIKAIFTGPTQKDTEKEAALRKIIAIKEPHYWEELKLIAAAVPYSSPEEATFETDGSADPHEDPAFDRGIGKDTLFWLKDAFSMPYERQAMSEQSLGQRAKQVHSTGRLNKALR